ncbi:serine/arginine repetitive matrix protein 2 [Streptomyces sp. NPDC050161]|uniref:serine/arginine repetitive matrix protein 2 n=1 Tax=Streptomyces sp. NPDC050161 TaxID=3365604 RepID=UPI0037BB522F
MPDFSIDYELLNQVQTRMRELADTADSGGAKGALKELSSSTDDAKSVMGFSDLGTAMWGFSQRSSSRAKDAKDGLNKLADIFKSVSDNYFQVDAGMADSAGVMGTSLGLDEWKNNKAKWDAWDQDTKDWNAYLDKIGASGYFKEHPDADINDVCSADGAPGWCETYNNAKDVPSPPGPHPEGERPGDTPPTEKTITSDSGSTHVKVTLDDDNNVMTEESTVTIGKGADEQKYTSKTTYDTAPRPITPEGGKTFDARDYTTVTTGPDGSKTTSRYVIEDDGTGTQTVTDSDGKETKYTRSGPDKPWDKEGGDDD